MSEAEESVERVVASYLKYLELGGERPELEHLDPEARATVERVIELLELTDGVALGGDRDEDRRADDARPGRRRDQVGPLASSDLGRSVLEQLRASLPPAVRLAHDAEAATFGTSEVRIGTGLTVGTSGGRIRVWLIDEESATDPDDRRLLHLNRAFRALPDTAAIALVFHDLSCLLLEPEDCAPTIGAPSGRISRPRYPRPIQQVGEAVALFVHELAPSWEPFPAFGVGALPALDVADVAAREASTSIRSRQAVGGRAHSPKKEVLTAFGEAEAETLAEMTIKAHEGRQGVEPIITRLRELGRPR